MTPNLRQALEAATVRMRIRLLGFNTYFALGRARGIHEEFDVPAACGLEARRRREEIDRFCAGLQLDWSRGRRT